MRTERLAQATAGGEDVNERWTFYPNGSPVTVQATISSVWLDEAYPVLLFEASPLEIEPEERRAVEALRHTSTLITLFDQDGLPVFSNPAAFCIYGLEPAGWQARFQDVDAARTLLSQALSGEPVTGVHEVVTPNGRRWHHLDARRTLDPVTGKPGALLNEIDVTGQIQAEQAWAAAEQKAAMSEARQRFLSDMSHDLRTPLNAVIGFSALLRTSGLQPEQADQAERIHASGHELLAVVEQMIRISASEDETAPSASPHGAVASPGGAPKDIPTPEDLRVLYVDDNANNRALVTTILRSQGISCQTADDGLMGFQAATSSRWDLILMDIQMPVMDGIEATRAIRAAGGSGELVPIIAVTANTLSNQLESYRDVGMNDCVSKPIDIGALMDKVFSWIDAGQGEPVWETEPAPLRALAG